jgi:hypothetical protein
MSFMPKPIRYQFMPYFLLEGESAPEGIDPGQHTPHSVVAKCKRMEQSVSKHIMKLPLVDKVTFPLLV